VVFVKEDKVLVSTFMQTLALVDCHRGSFFDVTGICTTTQQEQT